jgi:hypothetical protein
MSERDRLIEGDPIAVVDELLHLRSEVERLNAVLTGSPAAMDAVARAVGREYRVGFATESEMVVWRADARAILAALAGTLDIESKDGR